MASEAQSPPSEQLHTQHLQHKQKLIELREALKQTKQEQRLELKAALKAFKEENGRSGLQPEVLRLRERQRLEREQLILEAADKLLLEKGYHDTSIDDIAARVGISKGTVYLHFASKEDLVFALIERGMRQLQATLDGILAAPGTPSEKLHAIMRQMFSSMMSRQRMQLIEALFHNPELHGRLIDRRELFGKIWGEPQERITALIEEGKAAGEFDPETPTPILLSYFWSMLSPQHFRMLIVEKQMSSDLVVAHLSRCFFKGVAPGGACPFVTPETASGTVSEGSAPA